MALSFFLRLLLGHVIGDFVLQPYRLVIAKRNGWPGLLVHVGVVTVVTGILLWASIPNWWVWIIVLYLGHLFIDQFRTFVFTDNSKGKGLLLLILDQMAHFVLIALLAWLAAGWKFSDLGLLSGDSHNEYRMMIYLIGLAIFIGVVPVLEVEVTVAVWALQGTQIKHTVQIDFSDRLVGGIERIIAAALIITGYGLIAPLVFLPRLGLMIYQGQAEINRTAVVTKVLVSLAITVIVSTLLYNIPPPPIT